MNNPNFNILCSGYKALINIGTCAEKGGVMSAVANVVKPSGLSLSAKLGATRIGGAAACSMLAGINAIKTISQNREIYIFFL